MFWGLILRPNKRYSQTVTKAYHLSQAALDTTSCSDEDIQLMLTSEDHTYLICTLNKNKITQCALDLNFAEGDQIAFCSKGSGTIHLTGFLIPDPGDSEFGSDLEDEEEEAASNESDDNEQVQNPMKKEKGQKPNIDKKQLNAKLAINEDDDDDDGNDEDFNEEEEEDDDDDDEDEEDEDDSDNDEDDEEAVTDEEEIQAPKAKIQKLDKKNKQNGLENGKTQSKEKKEKKEKPVKQGEKKSSKAQTLQGGVIIEDIKVGTGTESKPGKRVQVYYEGRLKSNNKIFDSTKNGPGFKFQLSRGEVIRGWDIGIVGMKVGGKRRITCPPAVAYGQKGSPPTIPPNSTLVFDVELKAVSN